MRSIGKAEFATLGLYAGAIGAKVWVFCTRGFQPFVAIKAPSAVDRGWSTSIRNHSTHKRPSRPGEGYATGRFKVEYVSVCFRHAVRVKTSPPVGCGGETGHQSRWLEWILLS